MKHPKVIVIRRSCLTGKVIWVYRGPSKGAANKAYIRACHKEVERVRNWDKIVARRQTVLARTLADMLAQVPVDSALTPEQQDAAKELQRIAHEKLEVNLDFYNHIMEERRRREEDKKIRRKMKV